MSQFQLPFPLHLKGFRKTLCSQFIKTIFRCLHFRNVLALVCLINTLKTRITRHNIPQFQIERPLFSSHAQTVINSENLVLQNGDTSSTTLPKMCILITSFLVFFLMLILRIWFFKLVNLKFILCSKSILPLLVFSYCLMLTLSIWFFKVVTVSSTSHAQDLYSHYSFSHFSVNANSENWVFINTIPQIAFTVTQ